MARISRIARSLLGVGLGVVSAALAVSAVPGLSAPAAAPTTASTAAHPAPPKPTLGAHAAVLEGTWELVSMKLPDGSTLKPPVARGVIVIEKGVYLAASYLQPTSARTVGSVWEGQLIIEGDRFRLAPKTGYTYDSMAEQRVHSMLPPASTGKVTRGADGLVFTKEGGGTVTFPLGAARRIQADPDGLVMEHARTSLVPRIPDDLPGREPDKRPR